VPAQNGGSSEDVEDLGVRCEWGHRDSVQVSELVPNEMKEAFYTLRAKGSAAEALMAAPQMVVIQQVT